MNLIELQDTLRNLSDMDLQSEMNSPSGSVPPFLVLTELKRRKDMRGAYEGELAAKAAREPSVAEQYAGGPVGASAAPSAAGLSAMRDVAPAPNPRGFASGGIVAPRSLGGVYSESYGRIMDRLGGNADPYEGIKAKLAELEQTAGEEEDNALSMALIRAGLATAASDSPYVFQALGQGGIEGLNAYEEQQQRTKEDALRRLSLGAEVSSAEEARQLAHEEAARAGALAETGVASGDRAYELDFSRFENEKESADRAFNLAMKQFNFTQEEADRARTDRDRMYQLQVDTFGLTKEEAERRAAQDAFNNSLNERRVVLEEAAAGKPPAMAQVFDHFLSLDPKDQEKILQLQGHSSGSAYTKQDIDEASRMWSSSRKAVEKELEDDITYLELANSDDPLKKSQATQMLFERTRDRFRDDSPRYAPMVDIFGQASAARLQETQANRGLNIVDAPGGGATPPEGAVIVPLTPDADLGVSPPPAEGSSVEPAPAVEGSSESSGPPHWFVTPWLDLLGEVDVGPAPDNFFSEPLYKPIVRGIKGLRGN